MFCFHKFDLVQLDSFQYCKKCGLARAVNKGCSHKWIKEAELAKKGKSYGEYDELPSEIIYVLRCEICGDRKRFAAS